jgi:hypothetical protein
LRTAQIEALSSLRNMTYVYSDLRKKILVIIIIN